VAGLSTFIKIIWLGCGVLQVAILVLIVARRHYRTLLMFSWYIGLNLAQAFIMVGVYSHFGFNSAPSFRIYWATQVIVMIVQTLASTEALHRALQDYPGIWELVWRVILCGIIAVIAYAWATANSKDNWGLLAAHRGFYFTFAVAFVLCLLVIRHYSILIDPVYKVLLGGFCFYSCWSIVADTLLKSLIIQNFPRYAEVWNGSELVGFFAVSTIWVVALRHPVRMVAASRTPGAGGGVSDGGAYERLSPQVNAGLREMNDSLRKFFGRQAA
jgi:hypothetical protein